MAIHQTPLQPPPLNPSHPQLSLLSFFNTQTRGSEVQRALLSIHFFSLSTNTQAWRPLVVAPLLKLSETFKDQFVMFGDSGKKNSDIKWLYFRLSPLLKPYLSPWCHLTGKATQQNKVWDVKFKGAMCNIRTDLWFLKKRKILKKYIDTFNFPGGTNRRVPPGKVTCLSISIYPIVCIGCSFLPSCSVSLVSTTVMSSNKPARKMNKVPKCVRKIQWFTDKLWKWAGANERYILKSDKLMAKFFTIKNKLFIYFPFIIIVSAFITV